jgi:hypothetical protein
MQKERCVRKGDTTVGQGSLRRSNGRFFGANGALACESANDLGFWRCVVICQDAERSDDKMLVRAYLQLGTWTNVGGIFV